CERTRQHPRTHIQDTPEVLHLAFGDIKFLIVDTDVDTDPVWRVQDLCEIFGITILPPAHPGFIWIIDACYVAAPQRLARIVFFKVRTLAHAAVADAEHTFRNQVVARIKTLFNDLPFVVLEVVLHSPVSVDKLMSPVLETTASAFASATGEPIPTHFMPAARAASTPASASSITTQASGATPSSSAVFKNISGCGFVCAIIFPSTIASNSSAMPSSRMTSLAFLLLDARPTFIPAPRNSRIRAFTPGKISSGFISAMYSLNQAFF